MNVDVAPIAAEGALFDALFQNVTAKPRGFAESQIPRK